MKRQRIIKAYVYCDKFNPTRWKWWCSPFLNVKMGGSTKTPIGAKRAAQRTIKRLGNKAEVKIFWPPFIEKEV